MSQPNLCFFSTRCPHCKNFLEALSQTPFSREFKFICVDAQPGKPRPQLPDYVKSVPTLMIGGERAPREGASAALNWLAEKRLMGGKAAPPLQHQPRGPPQPAPSAGPRPGSVAFPSRIAGPAAAADSGMLFESSGGGPGAFSDAMCGNGDDGFCMLGEMNIAPTSGAMVSMSGNFVGFDQIEAGTAMPAPGGPQTMPGGGSGGVPMAGPGGPRQTEKARALQDAFDRFQAQRAADIPGPPRRI
jgi:hypothetical protein